MNYQQLAIGAVLSLGIGFSARLVAGLSLHGGFDVMHGHLIRNSRAPAWWPAFCGAFDLAAAAGLALPLLRTASRSLRTAP
ncbi:MAG: hypothetical protein K2P58_11070 [Hyphomonadaceae bacterium]|nr:hypothetical protein [Hyphomonadaceae bacterium]